MDDRPPIRYAMAGEVSIAYRVMGEGPLDLVWVHGLASNLEVDWESPFLVQLYERLASFSRLMSSTSEGWGSQTATSARRRSKSEWTMSERSWMRWARSVPLSSACPRVAR